MGRGRDVVACKSEGSADVVVMMERRFYSLKCD